MVPRYIHEIFKSLLCRYSTRSQMTLDIALQKTNKKKSLSLIEPKIWFEINLSCKNVKTLSSFIHAFRKILLHLQT